MDGGTVEHNKQLQRCQKRCKQAALNRTNSEMWPGENNPFASVCCCLVFVSELKLLYICRNAKIQASAPVQQAFMGWITCVAFRFKNLTVKTGPVKSGCL